jgi:hypothetical protein
MVAFLSDVAVRAGPEDPTLAAALTAMERQDMPAAFFCPMW